MNYLAHLFLANQVSNDPLLLVGTMMGDFVKGPLQQDDNSSLTAGIRLHRQVDRFTDEHEVVIACRNLFDPPQRRFAGIIVDVCFDHFLSFYWRKYSLDSRKDFISYSYQQLEQHADLLPEKLTRLLPIMIKEDWLEGYHRLEGVVFTLQRMATRIHRADGLAQVELALDKHYFELDRYFSEFFPDAISFVQEKRDLQAN